MAPKQQEKAKKVVEDKTFGVKNKAKSKAVRQFTESVQKQVDAKARQAGVVNKEQKKAADEARAKEMAELFAVAIKQPKVPAGVDPKSVLCEHFRQGQCTKGFKCKYSHDLDIERKRAKIDLFTDQRNVAGGSGGDDENMDDWDQAKLEQVIKDKHGAEVTNTNEATKIICKFFLDAVEKRAYGWFWKCPNGAECKYRHALPAGYILKSQMKELIELEAANKKDVAEVIEEERAKVDAKTPITEEVFRVWHLQKQDDRRRAMADAEAERKRKGILNGREIFLQEGFEATDDAGAADDYGRDNDEESEIQAMLQQARETAARAREAAAADAAARGSVDAGPSTSAAAAGGPSKAALQLDAAEEDLFLEDDDEGQGLEDDDDDGDEDLDALEAGIKDTHLQDAED